MKFKKELIEKLKRGEISLSNVRNTDSELIKSILSESVGHPTSVTSKSNYYTVRSSFEILPVTDLPIRDSVPAEDFIEPDLFEFSNDEITWVKGEEISSAVRRGQLLHMVELQSGGLAVYLHKRDIQPKVIERWVNVTPIGRISIQAYASEQQAKLCAGKEDIQVKLKGEIL